MAQPLEPDVEFESQVEMSIPICAGFDALAEDVGKQKARVAELGKILHEITKGKGRYSQDRLEHASNTIEDMKELARRGLELIHGPEKKF